MGGRHDCRLCGAAALGKVTRDRFGRPGRLCQACGVFNEIRPLIDRDEREYPEIFKMYRDRYPPNGRAKTGTPALLGAKP